jgi:hypothetical protein
MYSISTARCVADSGDILAATSSMHVVTQAELRTYIWTANLIRYSGTYYATSAAGTGF